jgi:hypothetical protein
LAFIGVYLEDNVVLPEEGGLSKVGPQCGMEFDELGTEVIVRVAESIQPGLMTRQQL